MKLLDRLALTILIIGGIHLMLIGAVNSYAITDTLMTLHIQGPRIFYILVGISALWCTKYYGYTPRGGSRLRGR
ncbi:DUF378 domain-containing protein [Allofustis seminis]|uniref:DUF378 domain-containing protein n=1 Tax=Allofustis seminis TaxID=166939 RepID=UPI00035FB028|nr:DUF378 domain-containing protein [Allofustis seminis]